MNKEPRVLPTTPYRGVRDFYPDDMRRARAIEAHVRSWVERWGYEEYSASVLEPAELYEAKASANPELVEEQTYTFTDRGGRRITLRPEMTPSLARLVAARARSLRFPLRWYAIPNLFRYERPQKGRLREHWQLNCDIVGSSDAWADAEVAALAFTLFTDAFGAASNTLELRISHRALVRTLAATSFTSGPLTPEQEATLYQWLDRHGKVPEDSFRRQLRELLPLEDARALELLLDAPTIDAVRDTLPTLANSAPLITIQAVSDHLRAFGITPRFTGSLVRGFNYYTGFVFEIFATHPSLRRALCGGGRYDSLTTLFGAPPIPGVGFGLGDVTLAEFLTLHNLLPPTPTTLAAFLAPLTPEATTVVQQLALAARRAGVTTLASLTPLSPHHAVREALKHNATWFACLGSTELSAGTISLKHLPSHTSYTIAITAWPHALLTAAP